MSVDAQNIAWEAAENTILSGKGWAQKWNPAPPRSPNYRFEIRSKKPGSLVRYEVHVWAPDGRLLEVTGVQPGTGYHWTAQASFMWTARWLVRKAIRQDQRPPAKASRRLVISGEIPPGRGRHRR